MCVIAGYAGKRPAAPILLEMIRRQEGLAGGYYTGAATLDGGRIHMRKVVGRVEDLERSTDWADLPGAVGVAHSRSNGGGDVEWAHPFLSCDDMLAYLANGSAGKWGELATRTETARRLDRAGHKYRARSREPIGTYPVLEDGTCAHMSDVMAHAIEEALRETGDPEAAIAKAFLDTPAEIVGLFVTPLQPDFVFGARWDMPACAGRDEDGIYVASSPEGFPESVRWWTWIPPSSVFRLGEGRLSVSPLGLPGEAIVSRVDPVRARVAILGAMSEGKEVSIGELVKLMVPLSGDERPVVRYDPVYDALHRLKAEGAVRCIVKENPGAAEGLTALRFYHALA